jgi:hypothetical protein
MDRTIALWGFSAKFAVFEPGPSESRSLFDKQLARPPLTDWRVPTVVETFEVRGKPAPQGDFPGTTGFMHLLSPRALDAIGDVFGRYGTLYPIMIEGQPEGWRLFDPKTVVDCLNLEHSQVALHVIPPGTRDIAFIRKPVFFEEKLPQSGLFRVPQCLHGDIYVCEDIKALVKRHKLKGFVLQSDFFAKSWIS